MTLEEQITEGRLAWIIGLVHDEQAHTLEMQFTRDPELHIVYGTLAFSDVRNYQSVLDYEEDRADFEAGLLIDDLFGIHEMKDEAAPGYFIKTSVREISFNTSDTPQWLPI